MSNRVGVEHNILALNVGIEVSSAQIDIPIYNFVH